MANPLTHEQRKLRGERARRLMNDRTFKETIADVEAEAIREWKLFETPEEREGAWALVRALGKVQERLRLMVADGEYAVKEMERAG